MARNRPKHVGTIGVTAIAPVIAYLQKHGIGSEEIRKAWMGAGGLDALVRFTRRRLQERASKPGGSLIRKSLALKTRREYQQKISEQLVNQSRAEIGQEIAVIKACKAVKDAWEEFCATENIPQLVRYEYDSIFDADHEKDEFEPIGDLKKAMVALSLTDSLCNPILERDPYGHRWEIQAGNFVRTVMRHEKGHATWDQVNYALEPLKIIIPQRIRVLQITDRFKERLSELPDDGVDSKAQEILLKPLQDTLGLEGKPSLLNKAVTDLVGGGWYNDVNHTADFAVKRLEDILKVLPDPNMVPCVEAVRRVVEIFESEPEKPMTSIQTLEDATILEHIHKCSYVHCRRLRDCTTTVLDYAVVRKWSDRPEEPCPNIIKEAKQFLASQTS